MNYNVPGKCKKSSYCAGFISMNIEDYENIFHIRASISIKRILEEDPRKDDGRDVSYEASGPLHNRTFTYTYKNYYNKKLVDHQVITITLKDEKASVDVTLKRKAMIGYKTLASNRAENLVINREEGVLLDDLGTERGVLKTIEDLRKIIEGEERQAFLKEREEFEKSQAN